MALILKVAAHIELGNYGDSFSSVRLIAQRIQVVRRAIVLDCRVDSVNASDNGVLSKAETLKIGIVVDSLNLKSAVFSSVNSQKRRLKFKSVTAALLEKPYI